MNDSRKAILICLIFLIIFSGVALYKNMVGEPVLKGDLNSHMLMAQTGVHYIYPPFFSWLSKPFAFDKMSYYYFSLVLLLLVFPLIFYWFLKDWRVVLFYFATGFVYRMDLFGTLPMALSGLIFFVFLMVKDWRVRLGLLLFALLVHSYLFFLLLGSWLVLELVNWWRFVGVGFFCNYVPKKIEGFSPISSLFGHGVSMNYLFNLGEVVRFFVLDFNLIFVLLAFNGLWDKRELLWVGLFVFVGSFFVYGRAIYLLVLVGLIGCVFSVQKLSKRWVNFVYVLSVFFVFFNLLHWVLESFGWCL